MYNVVFKGILLGLTLSVLIGPAFFSLIQTSIHRGFRSGMFLAVGIFLSDCALVILSYLGASQLLNITENQKIAGILGGILLILFGTYTFTRHLKIVENGEVEVKKPGFMTYIIKGFFLNIANPSVWFYWIFWVGVATSEVSTSGDNHFVNRIIAFFSATLLTVFSVDLLKCFIAHKIKSYMNDNFMKWTNHIVGLLLIIFGVYLIIKMILLK
jgi:threonine/homoserine/homoserine lactone efflux protein